MISWDSEQNKKAAIFVAVVIICAIGLWLIIMGVLDRKLKGFTDTKVKYVVDTAVETLESNYSSIIGKYNNIFDYQDDTFYIKTPEGNIVKIYRRETKLPDSIKNNADMYSYEVYIALDREEGVLRVTDIRKISK